MSDMDDFIKRTKEKNEEVLRQISAEQAAEEAIPLEERVRRDEEKRRKEFYSHYQHEGKPQLFPSYVVFADLLGVRALIMESEKDESVLERVSTALAEASVALESGDWSYFRYYSDCVSLITPVKFTGDSSHESEFGHTVLALGAWQAVMTIRGFPIRGGFAFGNVYVDDRSLFGKAHLVAYELESKVAQYPRILVCPDTLQLLSAQVKFYRNGHESPQERHVLVDADNQAFVSYLAAVHEYYVDNEGELLAKHRELIVECLASASASVRDKYLWMRDYHNFICDDWSGRYGSFGQFKIEEGDRQFRNLREWLEEAK